MKLTMQIEKVKLGLTKGIRNHAPAKILGALVLGAALAAVSATGLVLGQPLASEPQLPIQMELGEEWFHPVTGEPIGPLPDQQAQVSVTARSQGVLARPLSIGILNWGLGEEYFHPVTGENNAGAGETIGTMEVSGFGLGEEYFHPVTGEENVSSRARILSSSFNLGEEYFHPVTGDLQ